MKRTRWQSLHLQYGGRGLILAGWRGLVSLSWERAVLMSGTVQNWQEQDDTSQRQELWAGEVNAKAAAS